MFTQSQVVSVTSGFAGIAFAQLVVNIVIRKMVNSLLYILAPFIVSTLRLATASIAAAFFRTLLVCFCFSDSGTA